MRQRRIGILLFDGITALDLVGPSDAFSTARFGAETSNAPAYEVLTIGVSKRTFVAESGLKLAPDFTLASAPPLDTLIVPGGAGLREPRVNRLVGEFVRRRAARTRRIASVCTGIYGLAPTGLLDGRTVTTHWAFEADVRTRFPKLKIDSERLYAKDGKFYTAAGVTSGIDLSLTLIEEDLGRHRALAVARELVVYMKREGGQSQFSEPLRFQTETSDRLSDLGGFIATNLSADLSVPALAKKFALSPRQLTRRTTEALGISPAALVRRIRLDAARERLLKRGATVEQIALGTGFSSPDVFRRLFEESFGVLPTSYRERFSK